MKITLIWTGKTTEAHIREGIGIYLDRLKHYVRTEVIEVAAGKGSNAAEEGKAILKQLRAGDHVILLDERGKECSSVQFAELLSKRMSSGSKNLVFVTGGAYGFPAEVTARANEKLSLSKMTFTHQLVRLVFAEQLYRAFTILRGEKYHH